jgi:hypothetical protein
MIEFLLAFFVFTTIFIDTLSMVLKSTGSNIDLAKVYAVSQALTYITRLSLFFILPLIGVILDGVVDFRLELFINFFAFFLLVHGFLFYYRYSSIAFNSSKIVQLYNESLIGFFYFILFKLIFIGGRENSDGTNTNLLKEKFRYLYAISHLLLALVFPLVLMLGDIFPDYRGMLMGSTSVYTGFFSIYITFFIERKIPYLSVSERVRYIKSLVLTKTIAILLSCYLLTGYLIVV